MAKNTILDLCKTRFTSKTTKYDEYDLVTDDHGIPYILGLGNEEISLVTEEADDIVKAMLGLNKYIKDGSVVNAINYLDKFLDKIEKDFLDTGDLETYNESKKITIRDAARFYFSQQPKEFTEAKLNYTYWHSVVIKELFEFFKKYGLPESLCVKGTYNKIDLHKVVLKLIDLYAFVNKLDNMNSSYPDIEVSGARIGVVNEGADEFGVPKYKSTTFFDSPFEYAKHQLLITKLAGNNPVKKCENETCGTIFIPNRKVDRFCCSKCKMQWHRANPKKKS